MRAWVGASLLALSAGACLPTDTRPPPAEITVTVSSSEYTRTGISHDFTVDGFDISFQRVLVSLGGIQVGDDNQVAGCSEYSDPGYTRLFDFVLQVGKPFGSLIDEGGSASSLLGLFLAVPYWATARFLLYVDLRTRRDGWDVQVRFMALASQAEPEAAR